MRDGRGRAPLHFAAWFNGNPDSVTAMLEFGADPNSPDKLGRTPLHDAAEYNENAAISKSLMEAGADLHALDDFGRTLLHLAAGMTGTPPSSTTCLMRIWTWRRGKISVVLPYI